MKRRVSTRPMLATRVVGAARTTLRLSARRPLLLEIAFAFLVRAGRLAVFHFIACALLPVFACVFSCPATDLVQCRHNGTWSKFMHSMSTAPVQADLRCAAVAT